MSQQWNIYPTNNAYNTTPAEEVGESWERPYSPVQFLRAGRAWLSSLTFQRRFPQIPSEDSTTHPMRSLSPQSQPPISQCMTGRKNRFFFPKKIILQKQHKCGFYRDKGTFWLQIFTFKGILFLDCENSSVCRTPPPSMKTLALILSTTKKETTTKKPEKALFLIPA